MILAEARNVMENVSHNPRYKLDEPNCQRWIEPPFAKRCVSSNYALMSEVTDIETIRANLRRAMLKRGIKPTTLSLLVGKNRTLVKDLLEKAGDVQVSTLTKLAGALDVEVEWATLVRFVMPARSRQLLD